MNIAQPLLKVLADDIVMPAAVWLKYSSNCDLQVSRERNVTDSQYRDAIRFFFVARDYFLRVRLEPLESKVFIENHRFASLNPLKSLGNISIAGNVSEFPSNPDQPYITYTISFTTTAMVVFVDHSEVVAVPLDQLAKNVPHFLRTVSGIEIGGEFNNTRLDTKLNCRGDRVCTIGSCEAVAA